MQKLIFTIIILFCIIVSLTACGQTATTPPEASSGISENTSLPETSETATTEPEMSAEPTEPDSSETQTPPPATDSKTATSTPAGATSKPTNPPANNTSSQQPPIIPNTSTPTPSPVTSNPPPTPPAPEYEIMGQDYLNGVLKGINERRAALGLAPAKLDSALSSLCLIQAKKMAEAGYDFHSDNPTGCEGVAKVPYNFPAELLGDVMCSHVPNFLDDGRTKVGIAVVKKGNSLFAVVQGTY